MSNTIWIVLAIAAINAIIKYYAKKSAAAKKLDQRPIHAPMQSLDQSPSQTPNPTPEAQANSTIINQTLEEIFPGLARIARASERKVAQSKPPIPDPLVAPIATHPQDITPSVAQAVEPFLEPVQARRIEPAKPIPTEAQGIGARKQFGAVDLLLNMRHGQSILKEKQAKRPATSGRAWNAATLRQGFIMSEILSKPVSLRH